MAGDTYYQCAECDQPIVGDDVEDRHWREDGADVHADCCTECLHDQEARRD